MTTVSGIDPAAVKALVDQIQQLRKNMEQQLNTVAGPIASSIRNNYQGEAANSLLNKIKKEIPQILAFMQRLVQNMVNNINQDLSDTQNTDNALAK